PASLKEDLIRRDFSINAMAISLAASNYGELIDLYHGKSDLEKGFIRILHSRSFRDDATRILRAIRYEQRLDFRLESETARLLKRDTPMLQTISADRIRHELELILREKCPERALARLGELEVLPEISPLLKGNGWIAEKFARARGEGKPGQLPALYFCLLDYPLSEKENEQLILRLKLPGKLAETMRHTLRLKSQLHLLERERMENSEIYYLLQEYTPLAVEANAIATESITASSHLHSFLGRLRYVRTSLNGEELKGLGIPAGPDLGRILLALHKARLDGEVKTREEEKRLALSLKR
ncbi:MAG: hypothetical protein U9Q17_00995, partial [Chloroflexota bacterium]|nr:hypothetical protein [Chloroflexota bacterium]